MRENGSEAPVVGFVGFGEAAYEITRGLKTEGLSDIKAYDKYYNVEPTSKLIQKRVKDTDIALLHSLEDVVTSSEIVISATSSKVAVDVADEVSSYISQNQLFVDVNAASPKAMVKVSSLIHQTGGEFADVAMMGPVPRYRHQVPILASGTGAKRFQEQMSPYGMNINVISKEPGEASATKMIRSVFMKGVAALLFETCVAANKYDVLDLVMNSLSETVDNSNFDELTTRLLCGSAIHSGRRIHEMEDVIETLEQIDVQPIISTATRKVLGWVDKFELEKDFEGQLPKDYKIVLKAINKKLH